MALRRLTYSTEYGIIMVHANEYRIEAIAAGVQAQPPTRVCANGVQRGPDCQVGIWVHGGSR
jgi:hypothetical protein